jgi:DNA-binding MarR family transcriptional regulator
MEPELSESSLRAWRALLTAQAVTVDAVEGRLQAEGRLSLAWFEVLARLSSAEGSMLRMQDLANRLVLSRSGVTRLVDRLEAAGLIERASCASDRRGTYAVLTDAGKRAFEEARPFVDRAVQASFGRHLSDAEAQQLEAVLTKLLDASGYGISPVCEESLELQPAERR